MKLLAIETATEACSAALLLADEVIERYQLAPRQHNELILPMCATLLAEAEINLTQLDAIAFGCGPGAFTGVRIAAGITQGIALAHDLPVASVSTLANLAYQAPIAAQQLVLPSIDARMQEVYWAVYKKHVAAMPELLLPERVQAPAAMAVLGHAIDYGLGTGWGTYQQSFQNVVQLDHQKIEGDALPRAQFTAILGQYKYQAEDLLAPENALPVYLRDQVAHKKQTTI